MCTWNSGRFVFRHQQIRTNLATWRRLQRDTRWQNDRQETKWNEMMGSDRSWSKAIQHIHISNNRTVDKRPCNIRPVSIPRLKSLLYYLPKSFVVLDVISILVCNLIPNPLYTYTHTHTHTHIYTHLWCDCYICRKWTRWHEFKSWMRFIAFHKALRKV